MSCSSYMNRVYEWMCARSKRAGSRLVIWRRKMARVASGVVLRRFAPCFLSYFLLLAHHCSLFHCMFNQSLFRTPFPRWQASRERPRREIRPDLFESIIRQFPSRLWQIPCPFQHLMSILSRDLGGLGVIPYFVVLLMDDAAESRLVIGEIIESLCHVLALSCTGRSPLCRITHQITL